MEIVALKNKNIIFPSKNQLDVPLIKKSFTKTFSDKEYFLLLLLQFNC